MKIDEIGSNLIKFDTKSIVFHLMKFDKKKTIKLCVVTFFNLFLD